MLMVVCYINTSKDVINETTIRCRAAIAIAANWCCFGANISATITIIAVFIYVSANARNNLTLFRAMIGIIRTTFLIYATRGGTRITVVMIRLQVHANIVAACL
jgi:hypothetical protein